MRAPSPRRSLAALAALAAVTVLAGCGEDEDGSGTAEDAPGETGTSCEYPRSPEGAAKEVDPPPAEATATGTVAATVETSIGDLGLELDADAAPCTVNSFVSLAEQGYFDDTSCHRLTTAAAGIQVLQCGDPTGTGMGGPGYTISDELSGEETYPPGTLAMAKTTAPDSGGSQFFVVYGETPLPPEYTVFGTVDEAGLEAVQQAAEAGNGPDGVAPSTAVDIETVTVEG